MIGRGLTRKECVKHRRKKNINEKSTYMKKKIVTEKILEEIRASFPGKPVKTKSRSYEFTEEQIAWIGEHYYTTYCAKAVSIAIGIDRNTLLRVKAMTDPKRAKQYKEQQRKWVLKQREKRMALRQKKAGQKAKPKAKDPQPEEEKQTVWQWDIDEAKRLAAEMLREEEEREKAIEAEKADEELNHECFERRKGIKRTPIPYSDEEKVLRMMAYNKNYLLPDGDELFTDRRRCIYWDEKTERSKKVEAEADRLKFNVIEYRKMFPDMGNSMDSCKATKEIYYAGGR